MINLIIGRTGSGKDYLTNLLEKNGLKILKSYTTRPRRTENEDSHIFITPEEAATYTDKIATTVINGYEYFATAKQVEDCDVYVIDPNGLYELSKNIPDTALNIIYVKADPMTRRINAVKRVADKDKIKEEEVFDARDKSENQQFSEFEDILTAYNEDLSVLDPNVISVTEYTNDYDPERAEEYARFIVSNTKYYKKLTNIIKDGMRLNLFTMSDEHPNRVLMRTGGEQTYLPPDILTAYIDQDNSFHDFMMMYILNSDKFPEN